VPTEHDPVVLDRRPLAPDDFLQVIEIPLGDLVEREALRGSDDGDLGDQTAELRLSLGPRHSLAVHVSAALAGSASRSTLTSSAAGAVPMPRRRRLLKLVPNWYPGLAPTGPRPKKKAPISGAFSIAGAGFEPATFGL
jgi:hypothetical protein